MENNNKTNNNKMENNNKTNNNKMENNSNNQVKNNRIGHRKKMILKFLENSSNFNKTDLIELILFLTIPRKDVKDIAILLNKKFKSLNSLFSANKELMMEIDGVGENTVMFFKLIYELTLRLLEEKFQENDVIKNFQDLVQYCKIKLSSKTNEEFRIIFLNAKNKVIADELCASGTISKVNIFPREIIKRCLELSTVSIIMVHNHPSGDPTPSKEDIEITKELDFLLINMKINLIDHIIIGKDNFVSLRKSGYI